MGRMNGKTTLITGAASGLGRVLARMAHEEGAVVIAADIDGAGLATLQEELGGITTVEADLATVDGAKSAVDAADGRLDVLINNAAVAGQLDLIDEASVADWDRTLAVNLSAPFLMCRYAVPGMLERGSGTIVNVGSIAGLRGGRAGAAYSVSKWGLVGLTLNIAATLGNQGIRCNAVCSGGMHTAMNQHSADPTAVSERARRVLLRDRDKPEPCPPEQVAAVVLFLASDESQRVNGVALPADGGSTAY